MTAPHAAAAAGAPLLDAVTAVAEEIADLLRTRPDGAGRRIPGAEWSVGEAAAHLAVANELMADAADGRERRYGDGTPGSLAEANARSLAAFTERDTAVLAQAITGHARDFVRAAARRPATAPVVTPLGPMDLGTLGCYLLTHMLAHGYDIARALGRPYRLDRARVELCMPFLLAGMPLVIDPSAAAGHHGCYAIRLRGGSRFAVTIADGAATVTTEPSRRPDCTISIEPVAFFLLALGRTGLLSVMARGKVLSWGRRPWRAPGFPMLFKAP
ncbi:maleylpyruvate isomerase family mycothiol-dependent enzyme [Peterkaempfera griseoplana]|uniref:maleylpyruvate isomerase family mycothiol-dependent enzyme n=1 Tax=Peterkaempfera griseoplana TaxID=66896 RepID=UPI0006E4028F|nr:maleylpyruvate isomerase family mycothiol-dependent enzyme [Peterkaempfera griseoplana]